MRSNFGPIATFGIFAHDLGHHLDATGNKPAWMKDSWDSELRADAWAGCAIAKADLSPSRQQAALLAMSTYPSPHHPTWEVRRPVITEGFTRCGGRVLPPLGKERPEQAAKVDPRKSSASARRQPMLRAKHRAMLRSRAAPATETAATGARA
jgi:hypothetical protein